MGPGSGRHMSMEDAYGRLARKTAKFEQFVRELAEDFDDVGREARSVLDEVEQLDAPEGLAA